MGDDGPAGCPAFEAMYKSAVYATGDFAGVHLRSAIRRNLVLNLTYGQVEEASTWLRDGFPRGDDFAMVASVEITPFKGLDVRPIYSLFYADGTTNLNARLARGGLNSGTGNYPPGFAEHRQTVGVDARWSQGAFYFDPTILYQFGKREVKTERNATPAGCRRQPRADQSVRESDRQIRTRP
jgi:hypothetical protein